MPASATGSQLRPSPGAAPEKWRPRSAASSSDVGSPSVGREFDAAYVSHAIEMRKGLLDEVDDALENQNRQEPAVKYLRELKTTLDAELKELEALRPANA